MNKSLKFWFKYSNIFFHVKYNQSNKIEVKVSIKKKILLDNSTLDIYDNKSVYMTVKQGWYSSGTKTGG